MVLTMGIDVAYTGVTHAGVDVPVKIKPLRDGVRLPEYSTYGAAGMDIFIPENAIIIPGPIHKISCGFSVEIPDGYEIQIRPRSGLASKGIIIPNAPGTVDSDYRGEIGVLMASLTEPMVLFAGDKIAQMVITPVHRIEWIVAEELSDTDRGEGGFGSTGR